jgi:hypothetical protein
METIIPKNIEMVGIVSPVNQQNRILTHPNLKLLSCVDHPSYPDVLNEEISGGCKTSAGLSCYVNSSPRYFSLVC